MLRVLLLLVGLIELNTLSAAPRYSDPDGCMSCHGLEGLSFIDEQGVTRSASINRTHYYSSLHGSVPCKDCHRKIVDYPHKVENGYVDCTESCHIEEPSDGIAYTHKPIHDEMEKSVHADGWYKELAGGNRLEEIANEQDPSCRRCHSNTLYILESQLENFKEAFDHAETECGTCHQGKAWMGQFGGHILRRFIGSRWIKKDNNTLCESCHADIEKMRDVEQEAIQTGNKHPASERFVYATQSYDKTLHGRLLVANSEYGAECLDCHAPKNWKHEIRHYKDPKASTYSDELKNTCGQSNCHGYAKKPGNEGFVKTDMHDMALLGLGQIKTLWHEDLFRSSVWFWGMWPLLLAGLVFAVGSFVWWAFYRHDKKVVPLFGGDRFERVVIGRKAKTNRAKKIPANPPRPKPAVETDTVEVNEAKKPPVVDENKAQENSSVAIAHDKEGNHADNNQ